MIKATRLFLLISITLGSLLISSSVFAATPNFAAGIQFSDHNCTSEIGQYSISANANDITGSATSQWASDSNYFDPNCARVTVLPATGTLNKDMRVCVQIADKMGPNSYGVIAYVDQIGTNRCTPWATDGGGWSDWAYDLNGKDPDGGRINIETRPLPARTQIEDIRLGLQTSDHKCDREISAVTFTPWTSAGGGWSKWASGGADPNCYRIDLQAKTTIAGETCSIPATNQPTITLSDIQYVTAARGAATVCPAGRVFVGVDQQDHAGIIRLKCAASSNLFATGATTDVALTIGVVKGDFSVSNNCPAGHIINGVVQDGEGRETAVRCQPVKPNVINFNQAPGGVGTHGRSGDRYEVNFNENKAGEWVAFGAIYNQAPQSSRGISGYQLKPRVDLPPTPNACEVTPAPSPIPNPLPTTPTTPGSNTTTPAPTCSLTATPSVIALNVGSSKLEWNCSGSGTVTISATNNPAFASVLNQPAQGSLTVSPNQTTTFRVTSASASANVTVIVGGTILDETGGL